MTISFTCEHVHEKYGLRSVPFEFEYRLCPNCDHFGCTHSGFVVKVVLSNEEECFFGGGGLDFYSFDGWDVSEYDGAYEYGKDILKHLGIKKKQMDCLAFIHFVFRLCMITEPQGHASIDDNYRYGSLFYVATYEFHHFDDYSSDEDLVDYSCYGRCRS